jgi:hypothetical protein
MYYLKIQWLLVRAPWMVSKGLKSPEQTEEENSRDKMKISITAMLKFKTSNKNQTEKLFLTVSERHR